MLIPLGPIAISPALTEEAARHMRLASGLAAEQTADIADAIRAAVAHLEAQLGLCLIPRGFRWSGRLRQDLSLALPIVPVRALTGAEVVRDLGGTETVELDRFRVEPGIVRTRIFARSAIQGILNIEFDAGFGAAWEDTPDDLRRAVMMLTAHYYDTRHATGGRETDTPFGINALIRAWRPLRLRTGAA